MAKRKIDLYQMFLHLSLVVLAAVVVLMVMENRELRAPAAGGVDAIAAGDQLPPIVARDLDGEAVELAFDGRERETLLLVFTTTCPACRENLPRWVDLWQRFQDRYDVVGVAIDGAEATRAYVREHSLPFPVFLPEEPEEFPRRYGIPGVPQTLLVGTDGRVEAARLGSIADGFLDHLGPAAERRAAG